MLAGVGDLFKIGIGPSSSHTMGPMTAAASFADSLVSLPAGNVTRVRATLFGSLAWTGKGHGTDRAVLFGLMGFRPEAIDPPFAAAMLEAARRRGDLPMANGLVVAFDEKHDLGFDFETGLTRHPNAMRFEAFAADGRCLAEEIWFSVGGGFVERAGAASSSVAAGTARYVFENAASLLALCDAEDLSIPEIVRANEVNRYGSDRAATIIDGILGAMFACIDRGLATSGVLPGGLAVVRRAKSIFERLEERRYANAASPTLALEYVTAFAIAVNEENAAGGRVVTAPTNGAAGVVPAVLRYYRDFCVQATAEGQRRFLLAAAAIGSIVKRNASISGAEVGCQGEVGSAAAMAAAGLTAALNGTDRQIEHAAEIAIEHHLGMTCDPVAGLVQIPCIERNAFGAVKAITAAGLALNGDGEHKVTLDQAIETMRQTGLDMNEKYRETSRGGLAVNVPAC